MSGTCRGSIETPIEKRLTDSGLVYDALIGHKISAAKFDGNDLLIAFEDGHVVELRSYGFDNWGIDAYLRRRASNRGVVRWNKHHFDWPYLGFCFVGLLCALALMILGTNWEKRPAAFLAGVIAMGIVANVERTRKSR